MIALELAMTGYSWVSSANTIHTTIARYTTTCEQRLTPEDHILIKAIGRRLNSLFQPLNACMINREPLMKSPVTSALTIVNEISDFFKRIESEQSTLVPVT